MRPCSLLTTCALLGVALAPPAAAEVPPRLRVLTGAHARPLTHLAAGAGGRLLATAARDGTVRLWDLGRGGEATGVLPLPAAWLAPTVLRLSPDGRRVTIETESRQRYDIDIDGGRVQEREAPRAPDGPDDHYRLDGKTVSLDEDGAGRLVRATAATICLYDRALRHLAHRPHPPGTTPASVRFSPDGKRVAVGYEDAARVDVLAGDDLHLLYQPDLGGVKEGDLRSVAFSGDGEALYAGGSYRTAPDEHPIRRWEGGGRGRYTDLPGARRHITGLVALGPGEVAFAAADPAWGVTADGGRRVRYQGSATIDLHGTSVLVDGAGGLLGLVDGRTGAVLGFALADRALSTGGAPALRPPRSDDPRLPVLDWRGGRRILVGAESVPYSLPDSVGRGRSLHISADGRSFLLGTDTVMYPADAAKIALRREGPVTSLLAGAAIAVPGSALSLNTADEAGRVVAALDDGTVRLFGAADRREIAALLIDAERRRWALFTPGGFYDASPGGEDLLAWQIERPAGDGRLPDLVPAGRFRARYHRPDIVDVALGLAPGGGPPPAGPQPSGPLPPVVTLAPPAAPAPGTAAPAPEVRVEGGEARLRVRVRAPSGSRVTGLRVLLDGRAAPRARGVIAAGDTFAPEGEVRDLAVPLRGREATLSVVADSAAGASAPLVLRLPAGQPSAAESIGPKLYVLAVGVGAYPEGDLRLRYPGKDARDLVAALAAQRGRLYRGVESRVLLDGKASRAAVLDGLAWLQRSVTDLDVAVLFFAGHGIADPGTGQYFFLPHDADQAHLLASALPDAQLREALSALPGKVLLLLDTCHAGKILSDRRLRGAAPLSRLVAELASADGGVVVLAASTARQSAQEDTKWRNGAFTKALVEGLSGKADAGRTGRVTLAMLALYISERVKALTGGTQTPTVAMPATVPDFPLAATR